MVERERRTDGSNLEGLPFVSVIMIFLDARPFIAEAIESVLAQGYPNWELILVDDGSTDGSSVVARRFADLYPQHVRYLEHAGHVNRGMSASRNVGIGTARGSLIAFLDADDVWRPDTLERQVKTIVAQPRAAMVYGSTEVWYSWTGDPQDAGTDHVRRLGVGTDVLYEPPRLLARFLAGQAQSPATCSMMIRRGALELVGGFEERFRGLYEDQVIFAKLGCAVPIYVSSECWGRYRQHAESSCAEAAAQGVYGIQRGEFLAWLVNYVDRRRLGDSEVRRLLGRKGWRYRHRALGRLIDRGIRGFHLLLGHGPLLAFQPGLIPPRRVRRRAGSAVDEAWFRRAHEWGLLLRLYGGINPTSHVLELDGGLGEIAYTMRYILSTDGSYSALGAHRGRTELLASRYQDRYSHFRFDWADVVNPLDNPHGRIDPADLRFPYPDAAFDAVFSTLEMRRLPPDGAANYLKESARVTKPGGHCIFSVLLLDHHRPGQPRRGKFAAEALNVDGGGSSDFVAIHRDDGEIVAAYRLNRFERLAAAAGLTLDRPPIAGSWSGVWSGWADEYDLVVFRKGQ